VAEAIGLRCDCERSSRTRQLISGALATQSVRIAGSLVPSLVTAEGNAVAGVRLGWTHCWVLRERTGGPAEAGLLSVTTSCRADLPSYRSSTCVLGVWWWVGLVAVCCLRFA
jgi:hypothetical protein